MPTSLSPSAARDLTPGLGAAFARVALSHVTKEYPSKLDHVLNKRAELSRHPGSKAERRSDALAPLAAAFSQRFLDFLPKATYPTRVGTHFNSAFAVALALEYAEVASNDKLRKALEKKALAWFAKD